MMTHFPPRTEEQVTLANWRTSPFNRWAFHHVREVIASANIAHDPDSVRPLDRGRTLSFPRIAYAGEELGLDGFHATTETDALVILKDGRLIHESHRNGMGPLDPHICMSVSKSMLALLAGVLAARGVLDPSADCVAYVPELADTAFAGATVRNLLDMRTGITFDEDYLATSGPIIEYRKSTNWDPLGPGEAPTDLRNFLLSLSEVDGPHGGAFDYKSPCTDLLGWTIERAAGRRYADLFAELIWRPLGAESPAYITVDRLGAPRVAGGMCMTTRDLARVGRMIAEDGAAIVPTAWIDDIQSNGDPAAWANGSMIDLFPAEDMHYRSKWYVLRARGPILMGLGIHGQNLLVDRSAGLVLARHSSGAAPIDMTGEMLTLQLFEKVRDALG